MKILDEKNIEISDPDLEKGYLKPDQILVQHHAAIQAVKEEGHWETIAEYPNGGKDVEWIVDVAAVEAKEAWDEYEDIYRYRLYTAQELSNRKIAQLKQRLAGTDYIALKAMDEVVSAASITELLSALSGVYAQYKEVFAQRKTWRTQINELENSTKEN